MHRFPARLLAAGLFGMLLAAAPACAQEEGSPQPGQTDAQPTTTGENSILERADLSRSKGSEDAPLQIVEVSDFQCGFCQRFAEETMAALDSAYIETGQVRMIYIHYPLPTHAQSWSASTAALCAGAQDQFWQMHDEIFAGQDDWSNEAEPTGFFRRYAENVGLDMEAYQTCVVNDQVAPLILNDVMQITRAGITGTPTFLLGNERALTGHQSFEVMSEHIEELLAEAEEPGDDDEEALEDEEPGDDS